MFRFLFSFLPEQASNWGDKVDSLFWFVTIICGVSFLIVESVLIWFVLRYRRKAGEENKKTPFLTHNSKLEFVWTVIPSVVMMVIFYYGSVLFYEMRTIPKSGRQIDVTGKQWSWKFSYTNGITVSTQSTCSNTEYISEYDCEQRGYRWKAGGALVVPINQQIQLRMQSLDVIHSFYIPAFRVKQDVVPGLTSRLWFIANKLGSYDIFCAEYCGLNHSGMIAKVEVKTMPKFKEWLAFNKERQEKESSLTKSTEELVQWGAQLFKEKKGCVSCHRLDGKRLIGPPLNDLYGRTEHLTDGTKIKVEENYIIQSILYPSMKIVKGDPPYPPMNAQDVNSNELKALVEFLKSCKGVNCGG